MRAVRFYRSNKLQENIGKDVPWILCLSITLSQLGYTYHSRTNVSSLAFLGKNKLDQLVSLQYYIMMITYFKT